MYIDLLIKIKNAQMADKEFIKTRLTKMDKSVAELLRREGFLTKVEVKGRSLKRILEIHFNKERPIRGLKLLSRPSLRQYKGYKDFRKVKGGIGLLAVSTSKGVITDKEARKLKIGGEVLCYVY